jgi:hypothetical protein
LSQPFSILTLRRLLVLGLTATLLWLGSGHVSAGDFGRWHDAIHVAAFALLAAGYAWAFPRLGPSWTGVAGIFLAFLQEFLQAALRPHAFEMKDFALDAVGVVLGVAVSRLPFIRFRRAHSR